MATIKNETSGKQRQELKKRIVVDYERGLSVKAIAKKINSTIYDLKLLTSQTALDEIESLVWRDIQTRFSKKHDENKRNKTINKFHVDTPYEMGFHVDFYREWNCHIIPEKVRHEPYKKSLFLMPLICQIDKVLKDNQKDIVDYLLGLTIKINKTYRFCYGI